MFVQHNVFFDKIWQPFEHSFSQTRERFVIGAMSKRGQDTTSSDWSPMAKSPRNTNLVLQGQCKEGVSSHGSGSPVNPGNEHNRKRVGLATGNRGGSCSNAEVGSSQVYLQEMVNLSAWKLGQKDLTRPKSEEDSLSTGQPDAVSPEMENMKLSNYPCVEKICQYAQKKLGRTSVNSTFSVDSFFFEKILAWRLFMTSSMKAAIHTKFENIENVFNITQKLIKEHSEEFLNVKTLDYQSPSWTRSTLFNENLIKWAKAKVCVYANLVLCVVKFHRIQEPPMQNGQDKLKISKGIHHTKTQLVLMEKQLNSSGKIHRMYNFDCSQGDPDGLGEEEHRAGELQRPDHLYVCVQRHRVGKE